MIDQVPAIKLYKLPASFEIKEQERTIVTETGSYRLLYPILSKELIESITKTIQQSRDNYLVGLTVYEIVDKIDKAVQKWLDPTYRLRQIAENLLPSLTGYDAEMIRLELKHYMRNFRKKELLRFLDEEFDQATILDDFRPRKTGGMSMAFGPSLIFHVFSGNVPGVQLWSLIMGLLVKSANIGKTSLAEPLMAVLFCQSLAEVDERFDESIAILPWKGGDKGLEDPTIEAAEAVIVYGSTKTVKELKQKIPPHKQFLAYGHKISFAMIGQESLAADCYYETIHNLAEDVSIYDQQSCLSPQLVMVEEGGVVSPRQVAQMLSAELKRYNLKRPRAILTTEEAMAIQNTRNFYGFKAIKNPEKVTVFSSQDTSWTVIYHDRAGFEGTPLNRTIHVFATRKLEDGLSILKPYKEYLQSCGTAVCPKRLFTLAKLLGKYGVDRISAIGEMNRAQPGWHHDGGFNLLGLVRFIDIEKSAEQKAERYDLDVE